MIDLTLIGIVNNINIYNVLFFIITDTEYIDKLIKTIDDKNKCPFFFNNDKLICKINLPKNKQYLINILKNNIDKQIKIDVKVKKYAFDNIKGTSLYLKTIIDE